MQFFIDNPTRRPIALLVVLIILSSMVFAYVLLPQKEAKAQGTATLPMQIVQWIQQIVAWAKDYGIQNLQKIYSQITAQIQQWQKAYTLLQKALKDAWNQTRAQLLKQLTNNIIKWAQGTGGNTNFVSDWPGYISDKTQKAGQNYVDNTLNKTNMCNSFDQSVKSDVKKINDSLDRKTQQTPPQQTNCPVTNMDEFMSGTFSWGTWLAALSTNGNYYGQLFSSLDQLETERQLAYEQETARLTANQGFKGDGSNTPGIIQSYAMQRASMMDFDYLLNSKDVNEYLSSLVDAFITRIQNEGLKDMKTDTYSNTQCLSSGGIDYQYDPVAKTCKPKVVVPGQVQDVSNVQEGYEYLERFKDILPLIKENLKKLRSAQDKNLEIMNQIKALQDCADPEHISIATIDITPKIIQLQADIKITSSSLEYIDDAIQDRDELAMAADAVIQAANADEQEILAAALKDYFDTALPAFANPDGTGSLQKTISPDTPERETNLRLLFDIATNFSSNIIDAINNLVEDRGVNKPGVLKQLKKAGQEGDLSDTLYGQCYLERQHNACAPPCT